MAAATERFPFVLVRRAGLPFTAFATFGADWKAAEEALAEAHTAVVEATSSLQSAFDSVLSLLPSSPWRTAVYNACKAFHQRRRLPPPAWREEWRSYPALAPLLAAVEAFEAAQRQMQSAEAAFTAHYERSVLEGFQRTQALAAMPLFQRAMLFCSHALLEQLPRWLSKDPAAFAKKDRHVALSVLHYLSRMATRTTPLGHLATVAQGTQEETPFLMEKVATTPSSALLPLFYEVLLQEPAFYRAQQVQLNPCITHPEAETYTWLFSRSLEERIQRTQADGTLKYLAQLLRSEGGACRFEHLSAQLAEATETAAEEAERYLLSLADAGFVEWVLPVSGLSPGWCDELYRYLAFLPATPRIIATAALLQWLRTAARTLPHQPLAKAVEMQRQAAAQVRQYLEDSGMPSMAPPPERVFYEDIASGYVQVPTDIDMLIEELRTLWHSRPQTTLPAERSAFLAFAYARWREGHSGHFLSLAEAFLREQQAPGDAVAVPYPPRPTRIGALFRVFEAQGERFAALEALYPGGGKLFARWLHLFPIHVAETLQRWLTADEGEPVLVAFPWQGFSNANLQPTLLACALAVPGGRLRPLPSGRVFRLGDLALGFEGEETFLYDMVQGQRLLLTDLGLEAPVLRPPVMRLLWQAGTPYVSRRALLPPQHQPEMWAEGVQHWPRYQQGRWVLARASWRIEPAHWQGWLPKPRGAAAEASALWQLRRALRQLQVPRFFGVVWAAHEEPVVFDADSPLSMRLFLRHLRQHQGPLLLSEYWPLPQEHAQEWVVEFKV